ncbi:unnamed protein product [Taenia asiatica]|uniref:Uncharacterized protein n=1 Tax=Taenia asiatica TaxID=60517 RepID=A0A0R3W2E1_TAEAS|nr:unnamed protein product [Taenia asiatica]
MSPSAYKCEQYSSIRYPGEAEEEESRSRPVKLDLRTRDRSTGSWTYHHVASNDKMRPTDGTTAQFPVIHTGVAIKHAKQPDPVHKQSYQLANSWTAS